MDAHPVRVIVRLPYNRPEHPQPDPVPVSWNSDKEKYLWEVVAKSRGSESGAPDWKVLAARLDVPLPYLLYRAQVRYEHDLRGLQVIKGSLSPHDGPPNAEAPPDDTANLPSFPRRFPGPGRRDSLSRLSTSVRLTAPLGVRARLNSLTSNSPSRANHRPSSSSVLTLRGGHRRDPSAFRPASPLSSEESETDGEYERREEAERRLEEQEALEKKLKNLQTLLTGDNVGLVRSVSEQGKAEADEPQPQPQTAQGRFAPSSPPRRARTDASVSSRSQSISSASSQRGSIPSMPSPTPESPQSVTSKHTSRSSPANPAGPSSATTTAQAKAQPLLRYGPATAGSSASSFSDLSASEASLNSELESAFSSNIRAGGSRFLPFSPSHILGRGGGRV